MFKRLQLPKIRLNILSSPQHRAGILLVYVMFYLLLYILLFPDNVTARWINISRWMRVRVNVNRLN